MSILHRWAERAAACGYDDRFFVQVEGVWLPIIAGGGGGGKTTVVNKTEIPPKTQEELDLLRNQNVLLGVQVEQIKRQNDAFAELFPEQKALFRAQTESAISLAEFQKQELTRLGPLAERQAALTGEQTQLQIELTKQAIAELAGTPQEQEIRNLSNARALAVLRGEAPPLLPGQQERINTVFGRAAEEAQMGLRTFGEDLAAARGMTVADSPIGGELVRQGEQLAASLAAAKAGAELNVGQTERQFGEAVRQFQENLRQRGIENRLALTGRTPTLPLSGVPVSGMAPVFASPLAGQTFAEVNPLLDVLGRQRVAAAATRQTTSFTPGFFDYAAITGAAIGGAARSYGAAASSARLKRDIVPLDVDEYERALRKVRETPVTRWRYKWERDEDRAPHIGPILELSPEEIREDTLHVNLLDYAGLLHAGLKGLDRKVERFGERLAAALEIA